LLKDVMSFYESRPDLSTKQILEMWDKEDERDCGTDVPEDIDTRWILVKSRMRVLNMVLSYRAIENAFGRRVK